MAFKAKFDGKCAVCGGVVLGKLKHGHDNAMEITWPRRGVVEKGKVIHVNPTCADVAAGILKPHGVSAVTSTAVEESTAGTYETAEVTAVLGAAPEASPITKQAENSADVTAILEALKNAGVSIPESAAAKVLPTTAKPKSKITSAAKWFEILEALLAAMAKRILLVGPPGTGKSTTAAIVGSNKGKRNVYRITMTEGTGVEDLLGMFQLKKDGTATVTEFVYGPAALWMRDGGLLQIDEITHTPPEIQSLLYCLLDDSPVLTLPNGDVLKAHQDCIAIGTTNDNAAQLEPALMDRCEAILLAVSPHPDSLRDCSPASKAAVMNYYNSVDTTPWKFNRPAQVRPVRSFERLRNAGLMNEDVIAKVVFGESGKEFLSAITTSGIATKR